MTKPDHAVCKKYIEGLTTDNHHAIYLAACYLDLAAKYEALRKAAQRHLDALDNVCIGTTLNMLEEADAALRSLLEGE